jgi:hypothetical protein
VRWVGGFDLLRLRALAGDTVAGRARTVASLSASLVATGMSDRTAQALVTWALRTGVLAAVAEPEAALGWLREAAADR